MARVLLPSIWVDVYAGAGIPAGTPVRVTNTGRQAVLLQAQQAVPVASFVGEVGLPIPPGASFVVGTGEPGIWVFGYGSVEVELIAPGLQAQDGLWDGRQFRMNYRYSVGNGSNVALQFTAPCDFILKSQRCSGTLGDIQVDAYAGSTSASTFIAVPVRGLHLTTRRPAPTYSARISVAAATTPTITGGSIVETFDCYAGTGSRIVATVSDAVDWRILPAGSYYLKLTNTGNGTATGVYSLMWEELP